MPSTKTTPSHGSDESASRLRRRRRLLLSIAGAALALSAGGLGASGFIKSPQEVAAEAAAPPASPITVPVERRVLEQTVALRGTVVPGKIISVAPAGSDAEQSVVTSPPLVAGKRVEPGTVLAVVSGRPIIALEGKFPAYREMRDGTKGPDVHQLHKALGRIGYPVTDAQGVFGASTQSILRKLYADRGFEPLTEPVAETPTSPTPEDQEKQPMQKKTSVVLPVGEIQFVPSFPARVSEVHAGLGETVEGTLMTLSSGRLIVQGILSPADRALVSRNKQVEILSEELSRTVKGRVASVGSFRSGGESKSGTPTMPGHPIVVKTQRPLSADFLDRDVRITIRAASTSGPVLVVPAAAIYAVADGSTEILKVEAGEKTRRLTVSTGTFGGGFVEVSGTGLNEGDTVIVGTNS